MSYVIASQSSRVSGNSYSESAWYSDGRRYATFEEAQREKAKRYKTEDRHRSNWSTRGGHFGARVLFRIWSEEEYLTWIQTGRVPFGGGI